MSIQHFSRSFKLFVVSEVETGKISKEEARLKYGIKGNSAILNWQRQFLKEKEISMQKKSPNQMTQEELLRELHSLRKALTDEKFKTFAYSTYVEELEKVIDTANLKKLNTEQLTKSNN